ncbi:hypothetical protein V1509DRAFT_475946 [Lipomyces kononenkoae]
MTESFPQSQSRAEVRIGEIEEETAPACEANDIDVADSRDSRHMITTPNLTASPPLPGKEQLHGTRRQASSASPIPQNNHEPSHDSTWSTHAWVPNSKTTAPKRHSVRAFFTRSSVAEAKMPSIESLNGSECCMTQPDFSKADAAHIHSYYKKLSYSMAMPQALALDNLACHAHGSLFAKLSKSSLDVRTFVVLPRAILRYPLHASSTAVPEEILVLSAESVAYASDDIIGQQFVLRVSERPGPHQIEDKMSVHLSQEDDIMLEPNKSPPKTGVSHRSIFSHAANSTPTLHAHRDSASQSSQHHDHYLLHHHHHLLLHHDDHNHNHHHHISLLSEKARTMLLVFDSAPEFMRWLDLSRSQIKMHRDSLHSDDPFESEIQEELGNAEEVGWRFPRFGDSDSNIQLSDRNVSVAEMISSSSVPCSKRPSVASITSSIASQSSRPRSPLSAARRDSASSVQSTESLDSIQMSSSLSSLRTSLNAFSLQQRPPPSARRESSTFSGVSRLASLRRIPAHQRQPDFSGNPVHDPAVTDDDGSDSISSTSGSVTTTVGRKRRIKVKKRRSPPGPPPSRPLPPIPTDQN